MQLSVASPDIFLLHPKDRPPILSINYDPNSTVSAVFNLTKFIAMNWRYARSSSAVLKAISPRPTFHLQHATTHGCHDSALLTLTSRPCNPRPPRRPGIRLAQNPHVWRRCGPWASGGLPF